MTHRKTTLYIKLLCIAIAISGVLGYAYWKSWNFISGPQLSIEYPEDGITTGESLVTIKGTAKNTSELRLNGRRIFIDEKGALQEDLLLMYGYNLIKFVGKDKFGRETTKTLTLIYK